MNVNYWHGIGRVGKDPEVKFLESGTAVSNFSLAVNESWKDKSGKKQEKTTWIPISVWGKTAEICGEYVKKGSLVYVSGKIEVREYEKDGQKRTAFGVRADNVQFGPKSDSQPASFESKSDDDLPF